MPRENIEIVRSIYAAWARGDFDQTEWAHPEIEFVIADGPAPGKWTGVPAMSSVWRTIIEAWEEWRVEAEEYRELDDKRVLVLARWSGRGKTSGLELGQMRTRAASLFHISDEKVTTLVLYWNGERALADLEIAREDGSRRQ